MERLRANAIASSVGDCRSRLDLEVWRIGSDVPLGDEPRLVCVEVHAKGEGNEDEILGYFDEHGYERIDEYRTHDEVNWYFRPWG